VGALRLGTRGSPLARWQADQVRRALAARGTAVELVEIHTTGDERRDAPLSQLGIHAIFTRELDDALRDGRVDLAVHSLKDLPTVEPEGLRVVAVLEREDPRDALVTRSASGWRDLPVGAVVATSSLRRRAQLLRARPDLRIEPIRGNVETRLDKLDGNPAWAATVLAAAGLLRLGLGTRIRERLPPELMLPAPGQGAIAVMARAGDPTGAAVRAATHHPATGVAVAAERAFLRRLEGGCLVPVGALAEVNGSALHLRGRVVSLDGARSAEGEWRGEAGSEAQAAAAGLALAERVLGEGAEDILREVREAAP
jgi:hydroxymethylbilane synthase